MNLNPVRTSPIKKKIQENYELYFCVDIPSLSPYNEIKTSLIVRSPLRGQTTVVIHIGSVLEFYVIWGRGTMDLNLAQGFFAILKM